MRERRFAESWLVRVARHKSARYFLVFLAVAFATVIRFPFERWLGNSSPFLFYFPVVFGISAAFGFAPGCLATLLSLVFANFFWMTPTGTFSMNAGQFLEMQAFLFAGCGLACLGGAFQRQKRLKEHLRAMVTSMGDAIVSIDCCGRIIFLNAMAQILTGLQSEDAIGRGIGGAFYLLSETDHQPLNSQFEKALNNDEFEKIPSRLIIVSKTGAQHSVEQRISRILDAKGRKLGAVILFHNQRGCPA